MKGSFERMKRNLVFIVFVFLFMMVGCSQSLNDSKTVTKQHSEETVSDENASTGQIYLYGEKHGVEAIMNQEFELWNDYYHKKGMRHLFVELPYYTAEFLNVWMHEDKDDILEALYKDSENTASHTEAALAFYKRIKSECPETIFHGIDVGHQYQTTGVRFMQYLNSHPDKISAMFDRTAECIKQGQAYYGNGTKNHAYRENALAKNFMREYRLLGGKDVMGIFGGAHTDPEGMDYNTHTVPCMANQLKTDFGDRLHTKDLSLIEKAYSVEMIRIAGKEYKASYFGKYDLSNLNPDYQYREFWHLENAYDDFKSLPTTGNMLPYDNYPMKIEKGSVYMVKYTLKNGTVRTEYYIADGSMWENRMATKEVILQEKPAEH